MNSMAHSKVLFILEFGFRYQTNVDTIVMTEMVQNGTKALRYKPKI